MKLESIWVNWSRGCTLNDLWSRHSLFTIASAYGSQSTSYVQSAIYANGNLHSVSPSSRVQQMLGAVKPSLRLAASACNTFLTFRPHPVSLVYVPFGLFHNLFSA